MAGTAEISVRIPDRCARKNPKMNVFIKAKRFCDSSCITFASPLHYVCITFALPWAPPVQRYWNCLSYHWKEHEILRGKGWLCGTHQNAKKCKKCKNAKNAKVSSEMNVSISQHVSRFSAQRFPAHFPNTSHHTLQRIPMRIPVRAHSIPLNSIPLNSIEFQSIPLKSIEFRNTLF